MKVRVKGLAKLGRIAGDLKPKQKALAKACEVAQETTLNLISRGFKRATDPYGKPWNAPNNLQITGGIRRYAKGKNSAGGWSVHSTDEKAIWHHNPQPRAAWGGKALPTRLQVPTKALGWPVEWKSRVSRAIKETLTYLMRQRI